MKLGSAVLDRSRPFGEVWGGGYAHCYEQDDRFFNGQGKEVIYDGEPDAAESGPPGPVGDPSAIENQPLATVSREDLAKRYAEPEVAGKAPPRSWNKTKIRDAIRAALGG